MWNANASPDKELLPLLNQYCFRCHSSVDYHVSQKKAVIQQQGTILSFIDYGIMPQDRDLSLPEYKKVKRIS